MTDHKPATTRRKQREQSTLDDRPDVLEQAHTELRAVGKRPAPRAKVMPPELRDDDDDLFNDMPV